MNRFTFSYRDFSGERKTLEVIARSIGPAAQKFRDAEAEARAIWHGEDKFAPDFTPWSLIAIIDHGRVSFINKKD